MNLKRCLQPVVIHVHKSFNGANSVYTCGDYSNCRLLVSGHLQKEEEFFMNFVEGGRTVKEFCNQVHVHK